MYRTFLLALLLFAFGACKQKDKITTAGSNARLEELADKYIDGWLAWRPDAAVSLGFHAYDGKLADLSKESIERELQRLKEYDQQLSSFDTAGLGAATAMDFRILRSSIKSEISGFEDRKFYTIDPMTYLNSMDVNLYMKRNYAPLEQRLKSLIAVESQIPVLFKSAKANLADSLPRPYVETAIEIATGAVAFLKGDLVIALKEIRNDSLMALFRSANDTAIAAFNSYIDWLKKEKLPRSTDHYAIGRDNYRKMLLYDEGIDATPESILAIGLAELKKEQDVFNRAARVIDPNSKPIDVLREVQREHPTAESLIPDARKHLEEIRKFLTDKDIISIPSEARIQVKETPQYARSTSTASMDGPGPFEKSATEAYYYITPVDEKWSAKQKADWLTMFDYYTTDNVTIHEAYPGHYMQGLHLNSSQATKIGKIFGSYAFVEGWAHYCEKMMMDAGYGNTGDSVKAAKYRLAQSGDALLRICRLCVSIKMHCQGMTIAEGTKFFMDNWYQGEKPSYQEALRGSFDPGYLFYTVGKLEILKLREDYKKQEGNNYSLKKFHDLILSHGMPPVPLLREILLTDKGTWPAIM